MTRALGKLPAHPSAHPHRRLGLRRFMRATGDAPEVIDQARGITGWREYGNAGGEYEPAVGNCVLVALANALRLVTARAGAELVLALDAVLGAYQRVGDWDPLNPFTDRGCIISEALERFRTEGIGGYRILAWVEIALTDEAIREALATFGCVVMGVDLPEAAKTNAWIDVPLADGDVTPPSEFVPAPPSVLTGDWAPGSWGGHAPLLVAADLDGYDYVTWGGLERGSKRWTATYGTDAYAILLEDSPAIAGLDMAALRRELASLADTTGGT